MGSDICGAPRGAHQSTDSNLRHGRHISAPHLSVLHLCHSNETDTYIIVRHRGQRTLEPRGLNRSELKGSGEIATYRGLLRMLFTRYLANQFGRTGSAVTFPNVNHPLDKLGPASSGPRRRGTFASSSCSRGALRSRTFRSR